MIPSAICNSTVLSCVEVSLIKLRVGCYRLPDSAKVHKTLAAVDSDNGLFSLSFDPFVFPLTSITSLIHPYYFSYREGFLVFA